MLIDVRTRDEYNIEHHDDAINIPIDQLETASIKVKPSEEIILHCRSGVRAQIALGMLKSRGYQKVKLLHGTGAY